MTFETLKILARTFVSEAKKGTVGDTELKAILNLGKTEVAARSICLKKNTKFDSVADEGTYNLTSKLTRYLVMDKSGLWYRTSTSTDYARLIPKTIDWLNENKPGWRDASSGDPTHYVIDGDSLIVTPAPDSVITEAFWLYYGQDSVDMTENTHYPFGGETEITRLKPLHMAIVKYAEWGLSKAVNAGADNFRMKENEFERELAKGIAMLNRRKDLSSYRDTRMSHGRG